MIHIFYFWPLLAIVAFTATAQKLYKDVPVSNYEEHGVDGKVLKIDTRTGRFIPPKFPELSTEEAERKARDLTLYSKWKHLYCKENFFKSNWAITTKHFTTPNWCRFERTDGRWQDLCCDTNHCECDLFFGWNCKCVPYGRHPNSRVGLETTGNVDPLGQGKHL